MDKANNRYPVLAPDSPKYDYEVNHTPKQSDTTASLEADQIILLQKKQLLEQKAKLEECLKAIFTVNSQEQKHLDRIFLLETELAAKNQEISEIHRKMISGQVKIVEDKETQYRCEDNLKDEKIKRYKTELRLHFDNSRDLATEVKNLKEQLDVLTNESKELQDTLAEQKTFLELQGQVIKDGQKEISKLEAEIVKKNATIEELKNDLKSMECDREQLKNSIKKWQRYSDKKSLAVKVLEESCKKASKTDTNDKDLKRKRKEIADLKKQLKECENDKRTIKELENKLAEQLELSQLQASQIEEKERTIAELTGEVDSIKETYDTVLKKLDEANLLKKSQNPPESSSFESSFESPGEQTIHKRKKSKKTKKNEERKRHISESISKENRKRKRDSEESKECKVSKDTSMDDKTADSNELEATRAALEEEIEQKNALVELVTDQAAEISKLKNRCGYYKQTSKELQNNLEETSSLLKALTEVLQENEQRLANLEHELEISKTFTDALSTNLKSVKTDRDQILKFVEKVKVIADWKGSESESPVLQLDPLIEHLKSLNFGAMQVRSLSMAKKISRSRLRKLRKSTTIKKKGSKLSMVASTSGANVEERNKTPETFSRGETLKVEPQATSSTDSRNSTSQGTENDSFTHVSKIEVADNEVEPPNEIQPASTFQEDASEDEFVDVEAMD